MKKYISVIILLSLSGLTLLVTTCSKDEDSEQARKEAITSILNDDMIAYQPLSDQSEWTVNIMDYDNSRNLRTKAEEMCSRFTVLNYTNDNQYHEYSDSYPFFTYGFKALFFFAYSDDPDYHTLNDIVENCNFEFCHEIARLNCALLVDSN